MPSRPVTAAGPGRVGRAAALYTGLRLLAFVLCVVALGLIGFRGLLAILAALLLSSLLSLVLLRRQRDDLTAALLARREQREAEHARVRGLLDKQPPE